MKPFVLILLGAPGSGKGTQAERIGKELNLPHISSLSAHIKIANLLLRALHQKK